jgi:hypothetical protein
MQNFSHEQHLRKFIEVLTCVPVAEGSRIAIYQSDCIVPRGGEVVKQFRAARCALSTASLQSRYSRLLAKDGASESPKAEVMIGSIG